MAEITPASFADLKKAWDYWRHHQDLTNGVTPNARSHRLEFLRGIDQIKTQAKTETLRDAAERRGVAAVKGVLDVLDTHPAPRKEADPTGYTTARLALLEHHIREAITDAMEADDA